MDTIRVFGTHNFGTLRNILVHSKKNIHFAVSRYIMTTGSLRVQRYLHLTLCGYLKYGISAQDLAIILTPLLL